MIRRKSLNRLDVLDASVIDEDIDRAEGFASFLDHADDLLAV